MRRRRIRGRLVALGVALASFHIIDALPLTSFTPVNWSLVSPDEIEAAKSTLNAPIGCSCVESRATTQCSFFDCGCTCDLTAGACDAFCCCDTECTAEHIADVRSQGRCLDTDPLKPSIEYCSTDITLSELSTGVNALVADSILCVAVDNNEVIGNYIAAADEEKMTAANALLQNSKKYSFINSDKDTATSSAVATTYSQGDPIPVFANSAQAAIPGPYLMGIGPISGSLQCAQRELVQFGVDWAPSSCVHQQLDLVQVCGSSGGLLDPQFVSSNIVIATDPSAASSNDAIVIEVDVREFDASTGSMDALSPPYPAYYPQPQLVNTSNIITCQGAILAVELQIHHDGNGTIDKASAVVTVGEISTTTDDAGVATLVDVLQSFSVRFISTAPIPRSLSQGNLLTYERSGNPGYQLHLPVRVGVVESSTTASSAGTQAISEMDGGLTFPELGVCESVDGEGVPVLFGEDTFLTCTLSLNAASFQSMCERGSPVVPSSLRVNFTHVATFGNSDPFLVDDWLTIEYDEPTRSTATYAAPSGAGHVEMRCTDVLTSLHYEFLVAPVGPANDPQNKIITARASHGKETWTYWKNAEDPTKKETYALRTTVTFSTVKSVEVDQWIPPTPPIWFSIPRDVFYPFMLSGATALGPLGVAWTVLIGVAWVMVL